MEGQDKVYGDKLNYFIEKKKKKIEIFFLFTPTKRVKKRT